MYTKTVRAKETTYLIRGLIFIAVLAALFAALSLLVPTVISYSAIKGEAVLPELKQFPVTVDPAHKKIVENSSVNAILEGPSSPLSSTAREGNGLSRFFERLSRTIASASWFQNLAAINGRTVIILSGMRKEQVAAAFGNTLRWSTKDRQTFLTKSPYAVLPLTEGSFISGTYSIEPGMTALQAQALVNDRFSKEILERYASSTAEKVPVEEALIIASLIEREAGGGDDMRMISGIIWNRLFLGMNLQIDATLQYAKASQKNSGTWWPRVVPDDRFRKSAYNTYQHAGLPPTPIATPSVAAVIAALNPKSTACLYYFHDDGGNFHCSETYAGHVAALKKIYGRGK